MKTPNLISNMLHILPILMILVILSAALPASAAPLAQGAPEKAGQQSVAILSGVTERVSVASNGTQGDYNSAWPIISADGRYVAFVSYATNLVTWDTNGYPDIFVHDRRTGQTTLVSVASDGTQANSDSADPSISADGRYVAFRSYARNLVVGDTNGVLDIFVHDLTTGQTRRVSVASDGTQGNGGS
jgi:Tol biopolymer transport system component